ncbi:MAG TPA: hypothetical protein VFS18_04535 [Actinomycetota bacterium]|nr:hypothetical protein [Actinomycetota bacterium]
MNDSQLERLLTELGDPAGFPPVPDLAASVRVRIEQRPRSEPVVERWTRRRVALVAVAAAVAALLGVATFSPDARRAIADLIGVSGVDIGYDEPPDPVATSLGLGRPVSRSEAEAAVAFEIVEPQSGLLEEPDEIYVEDETLGAVSFVYLPREGLPEAGPFGVAALLTEFRGRLQRAGFEKFISADDTSVEAVTVSGFEGYWIEGAPHVVVYVDENGVQRERSARLAGNTLVWEQDGLTLRLESSLDRSAAVAAAETIR